MALQPSDVKHVMTLARLSLPEGETEKLTKELTNILAHVDTLKQADVSSVDKSSARAQKMVLREDVERLGEGVAGLAGAQDGLVKVPKIME